MFNEITSKDNINIKNTIKLLKDSSARRKDGLFVIEGIRLCNDALMNNIVIDRVFFTINAFNKYKNDVSKIINNSINNFCISEKVVKLISDTNTPQGIVCICKIKEVGIEIQNCRKIVILEDIQNPINLGTILRTCDAMGIDAVLTTRNSCDIYNPKVLRGSMGSVFHIPVIKIDMLEDFIVKINQEGFNTCAMVLDNKAVAINNISKKDKIALLIGNEGNGLNEQTVKLCSHKVTIPMKGNAESLNAAVAASIAIWEITQFEM